MHHDVLQHAPRPALEMVENTTPLRHFQCFKMAPGRRYHDVVVVKGSYGLGEGSMTASTEMPSIELCDLPFDPANAGRSGVRRASDAVVFKPSTDVFVTGSAQAPGGRPLAQWEAAVVVSRGADTIVSQHARLTGPRRWERRIVGWSLSAPELASEVPIRYELAYGGAYPVHDASAPNGAHWSVFDENPAGLGHLDPDTMDANRAYAAPQWEAAEDPVSAPGRAARVVGFGPLARTSGLRRRLAGTYDDAWLARARGEAAAGLPPDYAPDFDPRFFQSAHPALVCPTYLEGGEQIGLVGLIAEAPRLVSRLPLVEVWAALYTGEPPWRDLRLPLDTVHVDLEARRVHLTWRLSVDRESGIRGAVITTRPGVS